TGTLGRAPADRVPGKVRCSHRGRNHGLEDSKNIAPLATNATDTVGSSPRGHRKGGAFPAPPNDRLAGSPRTIPGGAAHSPPRPDQARGLASAGYFRRDYWRPEPAAERRRRA